jgi:hypothetical protein
MSSASDPLPYTDAKPHGHKNFYFTINATFRFILARFGYDKLRQYWNDIGASYYRPVSERWRRGGLAAVADYWRAFFAAESCATVNITQLADEVRVEVRTCPLIKHLREHQRAIVPCLCQHCYFVSEAIAAPAGMTVRVTGGNGACVQRFMVAHNEPAQRLEEIEEAS